MISFDLFLFSEFGLTSLTNVHVSRFHLLKNAQFYTLRIFREIRIYDSLILLLEEQDSI